MSNQIRHFVLNTGAKILSVGLGTWQSPPGAVAAAVIAAVKVGSALKKLFDDGVVKREDLFITSKLWCSDHALEDVPRALEITLQDLQLDYVDLYLIHCPMRIKNRTGGFKPENFAPLDMPGSAMEKLYESGTTWIKSDVLQNPIVIMVAEKLGKTPGQVALCWGLQTGQSVLPKSTNEARIRENFDVFDWSIPEDLIAKFSEIEQRRLLRGEFIVHEAGSLQKCRRGLGW